MTPEEVAITLENARMGEEKNVASFLKALGASGLQSKGLQQMHHCKLMSDRTESAKQQLSQLSLQIILKPEDCTRLAYQ